VAPVVTLSLGVAACVPGQDGSVEALLEQADAALYQAKQAGRNRVR
jgi:diguanylate cyclase (GGDEF)-like protein